MPSFAENLKDLPAVDGLERLELYAADAYAPVAVIENAEGQRGSLAVYYKVSVEHGGIGPAAAREALTLFSEKASEAQAAPGTHPNIDRLFAIVADNEYLSVKAVPKNRGGKTP